MITKSESIKLFLTAEAHPDLAALYHLGMEVQVNVASDGGTRIDGNYLGRQWHGWTDGLQTWKPFRIPWNAKSDPTYTDSQMAFDLSAHCEGIGMTGWCWTEKKSYWFGYDFDSIAGHSINHRATLTDEELAEIKAKASAIPWVTVRKSTGGAGLHFYIHVNGVPTANHNEHAALARAILGKLSMEVGYDFSAKIDVCGGNMWVWHRKLRSNNEGLTILKQGEVLTEIPSNWQDHIKVVRGQAKRVTPSKIQEVGMDNQFEELVSSRTTVALDAEHHKLIDYLKENKMHFEWHQDHHMLVTHTLSLAKAHEALGLVGVFATASRGSSEVNCFLFPMRAGVWVVRRYTPGVAEAESWEQDKEGWTKCFLNKSPDLAAAARTMGGIENEKGQYVFQEAEIVLKSASYLGANFELPTWVRSRKATMQKHKDGRLVVKIEHRDGDQAIPGWIVDKKLWVRIFNVETEPSVEAEINRYDDMMRHMVTQSDSDNGWALKTANNWTIESASNIKLALKSFGLNPNEIDTMMGSSVMKPWKIVNKPFQPEYIGDRQWNKRAARLKYTPTEGEELSHPHWDMILRHTGSGLDEAIKNDPWARVNGLLSGADYLRCWVASLFQAPEKPLPYLAFWGPQNSGKSIFHEALNLLFTRGYTRADTSLVSNGNFNGELEAAVLCVVEETDLTANKQAYNKIKDWVTSPDIMIHPKRETPYMAPNTTHWVQCSNDYSACPAFPGDTRITLCYVKALEESIPKEILMEALRNEAPDFLASVTRLEIPPSNDRLNVPVITTEDKRAVEEMNQTALELFLSDQSKKCDGNKVLFSTFYDRFIEWVSPQEANYWTKIRVGKELPPTFPKGRSRTDANKLYVLNICWAHETIAETAPLKVLMGNIEETV